MPSNVLLERQRVVMGNKKFRYNLVNQSFFHDLSFYRTTEGSAELKCG